jgi:predicted kinase
MLIVVLLKGPPGSGKSTLARKLSQHLQWPHIDKDDVRDCFQPVAFKHPSVDWNELSYDVMFSVLEAQLRVGVSCIVDCPLARICLFSRAEYLTAKVT